MGKIGKFKFQDKRGFRRRSLPKLTDATMVIAFEGWNDAGNAASLAMAALRRQWQAIPFAEVDSEEFFNFIDTRPDLYIAASGKRLVNWPKTTISLATSKTSPGNVVFVYGVEPQLKWKSYSTTLSKIAKKMHCRRAIFLGSYASDVLHDKPVQITVTGDIDMGKTENRLTVSTYEGPVGIIGILQMEFESRHIPTGSIWASVPNYSEPTSPKAALALVSMVKEITHGSVSTVELERLSLEYEQRMTKMVQEDELLSAYVKYVSQQNELDMLASGSDTIVKEIEKFLREENN
jgi:proteasome assembly chaperone (PAC2) family protein